MLPLTQHAIWEMQKRGITEEEVTQVFEQPEQKIGVSFNREIWQNIIELRGKKYVLRIVVELSPSVKIITVYKSSKVSKYWKGQS